MTRPRAGLSGRHATARSLTGGGSEYRRAVGGGSNGMDAESVQIRQSRAEDGAAIHDVHALAFGRADEARLVAALQAATTAPVSLIATIDGEVVAHVHFSRVEIVADGESMPIRAYGLAPLSVLPAFQGRGIGSRLVREGLAACREAGAEAVVVLGDPAYYGRFGFRRASEFGLDNEYGVDAEFMAIEVRPGALAGARGVVRYRPEFGDIGA
ncbi:MAG TPA: N-acetyltransferase [Thermomicrobiales bacterium]|nr:N-acetyltransferase [Thermomicrobiales bacterium]